MVEQYEEHAHALLFPCPRCGQKHCDEYEVLDTGQSAQWRCSQCVRCFSLLLTECEYCATETVNVALADSELPQATDEPCEHCGKRPFRHEEVEF